VLAADAAVTGAPVITSLPQLADNLLQLPMAGTALGRCLWNITHADFSWSGCGFFIRSPQVRSLYGKGFTLKNN
jgi:hypothetical protein